MARSPEDGKLSFHSASCGADAHAMMARVDAAVGVLAADEPIVWLERVPPEASAASNQEDGLACLAGALFAPDGQVCGRLVFVWLRAPEAIAPYRHAMWALGSYARHAVLTARGLKAKLSRFKDAVDQYEALLDSAPVLFNAFESDGRRCVTWNKECERRFGWTRQEIFDHPDPLALFYPDPEERCRVIATVSFSPSRSFQEWSPLTSSGERMHALWANVRMPNGRIVNIGVDITERKRAEVETVRLSKIDSLTECWNRKEIVKRLGDMIDTERAGGPGVVAMILDLDFFKKINDRHGHLAGDHALRHFCRQVRSCLRGVDQFGRLGGEEFLVLLYGADVGTAVAVFERLQKQLHANPVLLENELVMLTVSAGIATLTPDALGVSDILRRADIALYEAKRQGRDRIVIHPVSTISQHISK